MSYELQFLPSALKEWKKLGDTVREQFKAKLVERLEQPRVEADRLRGGRAEGLLQDQAAYVGLSARLPGR